MCTKAVKLPSILNLMKEIRIHLKGSEAELKGEEALIQTHQGALPMAGIHSDDTANIMT